jgi:hypothetical protein
VRVLPARKAPRRLIIVVVVLGVMAALWYWVFPWADRTFVNRPAVENGLRPQAGLIVSVPAASRWIASGVNNIG